MGSFTDSKESDEIRLGKATSKRIASFRDLLTHLREDYEVNGGNAFRPGFQSLAVYRFGVWVDGLRWAVCRWPLRRLYFVFNILVRNLYGIELYYTVRVGRRLRIAHQSGIVFHKHVTIGDDCLVRHNVTIGVTGTGGPREDVPTIGDRVAIGAGAVILSPSRIGDDVVIGPNVVVRMDVPSFSTVLPNVPEVRRRNSAPRIKMRPSGA